MHTPLPGLTNSSAAPIVPAFRYASTLFLYVQEQCNLVCTVELVVVPIHASRNRQVTNLLLRDQGTVRDAFPRRRMQTSEWDTEGKVGLLVLPSSSTDRGSYALRTARKCTLLTAVIQSEA